MQLGDFRLSVVSGGRFRIDGGTMFGVVPKTLWNRKLPADDHNRIAQATNCLLVETGDQTVLIDTGYGSKLSDKQRKIFESEPGDPLVANLNAQGVSTEEIDLVILSHLHFDHAGGETQRAANQSLVPTFPKAKYVVQRAEWVTATAEFPELRGAYPLENLLPLQQAGQLELIDGSVEFVPGIRAVVTGGHTHAHQALMIESRGETAVYLGDICPTTHHLPTLWGMAYDVDQLQVRRKKPELLRAIADGGWTAFFDHDPDIPAARVQHDSRKEFAVAEVLE